MIDHTDDSKKSGGQLISDSKKEWNRAQQLRNEAKQARQVAHDKDRSRDFDNAAQELEQQSKHDYQLAKDKYKGNEGK